MTNLKRAVLALAAVVILVVAALMLTVSIGGQALYGQNEPQTDELNPLFLQNFQFGPPAGIGEQDPVMFRLNEMGLRGTSSSEIILGPAGTYIRADEFRFLNDGTAVEAIGNVVMTTMRADASPPVTIKADSMIIGEGQ